MAKYRYNISHSTDLVKSGAVVRYAQSFSKVALHSSIQQVFDLSQGFEEGQVLVAWPRDEFA